MLASTEFFLRGTNRSAQQFEGSLDSKHGRRVCFGQVEGLVKLARLCFGAGISAMEVSQDEVGLPLGGESGPRWAQEEARGAKIPEKGSKAFDPSDFLNGGRTFGVPFRGPSWAILGHLGPVLGCLRGFLGWCVGLCRAKLRVRCCEDGKQQILQKPCKPFCFEQAEGLAKLARWGFGARASAMGVSNGEVEWQLGCEHDPRWAQEGPRGPEMARKEVPNMWSFGFPE